MIWRVSTLNRNHYGEWIWVLSSPNDDKRARYDGERAMKAWPGEDIPIDDFVDSLRIFSCGDFDQLLRVTISNVCTSLLFRLVSNRRR